MSEFPPRHEQETAEVGGRARERTRDSERVARGFGGAGLTLGRWEVQEEIARGGMGAVYRAVDAETGQEAALKVIVNAEQGDRLRRFQREIQAIARLEHPNIVPAIDHGEARGHPYLAMELVRGETLSERLAREGPLEPRAAAELMRTLARAMSYAHEQGVLHRDLKPDNVLLHPGLGAVLTDFGLAKELGGEQSLLTHSGVGLGTPGYWSPEQATGNQELVGPASDVYSLGATLYAALTGCSPHEGDSFHAILVATVSEAPRSPGVDRDLDRICLTCLQKEPKARYRSMDALEGALSAYLRGERRVPAARKAVRVTLLLAVLLLVLGGAGFGVYRWRARVQAEEAAARAAETKRLSREALTAFKAQRFDEAAELYGRVLQLKPEDATFHYNRGRCLLSAGRVDEALAELDEAIAREDDFLAAWLARGELLKRNDRDDEAVLAFNKVLELNGEHGGAYVGRASAQFNLGRAQEALADYSRAIELGDQLADVQRVEAWGGRAAVRFALEDYPGALADFDEAVRMAPKDVGWLMERSRLQLRLGMGADAAEGFTRIMELARETAALRLLRGKARLIPPLRDFDGAIEDFERALVLLAPDDPAVSAVRAHIELALELRAARDR